MTTTDRPPSGPSQTGPITAPGSPSPDRPLVLAVVAIAVAVLAGLVAAVALTRGGPDQPQPAPAPPPQAAPDDVGKPTQPAVTDPEPLTAEQQAVAAAETAYRSYLALDDELSSTLPFGADYGAYEQAFSRVATGLALTEAGLAAGDLAKAGQRTAGTTGLASLEVTSVDLRNDGGFVPEVVFDACVDYNQLDVLDAGGKSLKDPDGPTRYSNAVTVRNYPDRGGWLLAERVSDGTTC